MEKEIPYIRCAEYEDVREKAHSLKNGDRIVIRQIAEEMSDVPLPGNSVLVPVPSHHGYATYTKDLAELIAKAKGLEVCNVLLGKSRQASYELKKQGMTVSSEDLGFRCVSEIPNDKIPVFIDNVIGTGTTAKAAVEAVGRGIVFAYADDFSAHAVSGLKKYEEIESFITSEKRQKTELIESDERMKNDSNNTEKRQEADDRIKPVFTGLFVQDKELLKLIYPTVHENEFYDHVTLQFKPGLISRSSLGEKGKILITGRLTTEKVDVLLVDVPDTQNEYSHITLATAEGVAPKESNSEISKYFELRDKFDQLDFEIQNDAPWETNLSNVEYENHRVEYAQLKQELKKYQFIELEDYVKVRKGALLNGNVIDYGVKTKPSALVANGFNPRTMAVSDAVPDKHTVTPSPSIVSSARLSQPRNVGPLTNAIDAAKVRENTEITKQKLKNSINKGKIISKNTPMDAVRKLAIAIGLDKSSSSHSYYKDVYEEDYQVNERSVRIRLSTHPANGERINSAPTDDRISFVIYRNGSHRYNGDFYEITFHPSKVQPVEAANIIRDMIDQLINTGEIYDFSKKSDVIEYHNDGTSVNKTGELLKFNDNSEMTEENQNEKSQEEEQTRLRGMRR